MTDKEPAASIVAPREAEKFNLRLPADMRERIKREAKKAGRSMNTEIVTRLAASFDMGRGLEEGGSLRGLEAKVDRILELLEKR